ncbi:abortive infection protein [Actinomycetospora sp. NBRC 106375]|uniref:CPBP family glutamic-type intramembrane protease n=1 Tax=Actinomycetospora sp. NBRC 106375 TaxID=3032207 RepID=UPI0024A2A98D|nr:CPBP family glutamic-type intramembrane protease [Actinomycetospora sp. NBRC 106375]GLZ48535.1 abortive infection protein [Actinomycetospora sp. NBRC 106375]
MRAVRRHPLVTFFVLTYVIAWAFVPFGSFGAFAPLVAALIVVPISQGRAGLAALGRRIVLWRVRWWWWALALAVPVAIHVLAAILGDSSPLRLAAWGDVLLVFLLRLVNPTDGAFGEEPGWRGFALPGLQSRLSPLAATAVLAVIVTVWHLPLVLLAEGDRATTLVGMIVGTVGVTFWYSWLFDHAGGSVLLVVVAHAVEGAIQDDTVLYFTLWLALAVVLVVVDLRWWLRPAPAEATTAFPPAPSPAVR